MVNTCHSRPVNRKPACTLAVIAATLLFSSACSELRKVTYPPDFVYLNKSDVQTVMSVMAAGIDEIAARIPDGALPPEAGSSTEILNILYAMEYSLSELQSNRESSVTNPLVTNHLLIDEHLKDFMLDIARAKFQLQATPANYYGVGQLTGGCAACHSQRR
jgi:hypothetical protein